MSPISSQTHAISINPTTGEQIGHYAFESAEALDAALTRAAQHLPDREVPRHHRQNRAQRAIF
ncbi:hypothetical protein GHO45_24160, partial [Pseudomonas sp. FSL R10-0765]|uniref:hypothetical protein n=1 Tax=Pseudomonas sp. FSL R10-0765 TaxID=2662195 RepID=UPI001296E247